MNAWFSHLARRLSIAFGTWQAFFIACFSVLAWFIAGFFIGFGNQEYNFFINTGTTIVTFLMVFLLQATQNRETLATHIKLDALIKANADVHNKLLAIEDATEEELKEARDEIINTNV